MVAPFKVKRPRVKASDSIVGEPVAKESARARGRALKDILGNFVN